MRSPLPAGVHPETPGPGQESVWDYPRPPRLERSTKHVVVRVGGVVVAETDQAWRVLETSHPPTWYLPRPSVGPTLLVPSAANGTVCEWKGPATYWDLVVPGRPVVRAAAWSYEHPTASFRPITGHLGFQPGTLTCEVDGEVARAQQGGFYAGWITDDVVGPFKSGPGSWGW